MDLANDRFHHRTLSTNGIRLHGVELGPEDGPPVILLHGFPEFWYGWRHQVGALSAAGFRVTALDQRGYGASEKPGKVSDYALDRLADDVAGLMESSPAMLVGHDWGGIVAWWVALRYPDRVKRLVVLNAPHPVVFKRALWRWPRQLVKSWYTFSFQIPWLPEAMLRRKNWRGLANSLRATSRSGSFTDDDLARYREAWSEPGAITAMINWYRAAVRDPPRIPEDLRVHVPALLIWGTRDRFLDRRLAEPSLALCDRGRLEWFKDATHWVQHDEPERVNRLLISFLGEGCRSLKPGSVGLEL